MVSSSSSASTPGVCSISFLICSSSLAPAARPMSSDLLSAPSLTATAISSTPIAIEAPPSQTAGGQDQPQHGRGVLEQRGLDRGVGALLHVLDQLGLLAPGLAMNLAVS